ncbi:PD-(D/E)XK nuclease family protein [Patescibacteria group bacterium]|nr:PD-(D/E)XK nuclease family protein [Patescibacteria group bacterium]MBU4368081.1 PD-(D/E)XK nuclease family protein [Patescibacteria group bacterium]MBU4462310.1 PD-(D/E)XK nuclease family protein [Patescibacteria group bacterium]MCG2700359.1 PD-(D/E)XK nuclease family protein [Candidatus Parcubacteria bacterium]
MPINNSGKIQLSPNSLNLYLECPHCFWLEKKMGIRRPPPYPYALNSAVDVLLKQEFDTYREKGELHPLLIESNIPAKLFSNQNLLNQWRSNFSGIRYYDPEIGATLFGAVDDVLEFPDGKLAPLDYKSTGSKVAKVYDRFQIQMDIYTYLLEKNGFQTPRKGYLAFYVVDKSNGFINRLPFRKELHVIDTNPDDVRDLFKEAVAVLMKDAPPPHSQDCKFANWFRGAKTYMA